MKDWSRHPLLCAPNARAIAHRGGAGEAEENTLPAFRHAVALGYTHVELDVHATRDGQVVIHHDADMRRMFDDPRKLAELDWATLSGLRTRGGASVPLLADLLEEFPRLFIAIELKCDRVAAPLASLLQRMGALGRVSVGSFAPARTAAACALLGEDALWSPAHLPVARLWAAGWGLPAGRPGFGVVQVPEAWNGIPLVTPRFVRAAHARGVAVQVWTVNDEARMQALLDMGADGIMTDRPSLLRDVLQARGEWSAAKPLFTT